MCVFMRPDPKHDQWALTNPSQKEQEKQRDERESSHSGGRLYTCQVTEDFKEVVRSV